jgi:hypothetical protein
VCNHRETTNQAVEVANVMLQAVRKAKTLANSLLALEEVQRRRTIQLRTELLEAKSVAVGGHATWEQPWPPTASVSSSHVPVVKVEAKVLSFDASRIVHVEEVTASDRSSGGGKVFNVTERAKLINGKAMPPVRWNVRPSLARYGPYEDACSCGRHASEYLTCDHVQCVLESTTVTSPEAYRKYWLSAEAWQAQVGELWEPLSAMEILSHWARMEAEGSMPSLLEPNIAIQGCGRPSGKLNAATTQRLRAFWEVMEQADILSESVVKEVYAHLTHT